MPARSTTSRALALLCAAAVALVACSYGGDGDEESASTSTTEERTRETTEETVLGTVFERDIAPAAPAEPVPVPTTAAPTTTTRRPTTTTTVATTTTTAPAPRPNHLAGRYGAQPNATSVTVELYREEVLVAGRDLNGSGEFEFTDLPPGFYVVLITDRQAEDETSSQVISRCPEVGLIDGDSAFVDSVWDGDCTVTV